MSDINAGLSRLSRVREMGRGRFEVEDCRGRFSNRGDGFGEVDIILSSPASCPPPPSSLLLVFSSSSGKEAFRLTDEEGMERDDEALFCWMIEGEGRRFGGGGDGFKRGKVLLNGLF